VLIVLLAGGTTAAEKYCQDDFHRLEATASRGSDTVSGRRRAGETASEALNDVLSEHRELVAAFAQADLDAFMRGSKPSGGEPGRQLVQPPQSPPVSSTTGSRQVSRRPLHPGASSRWSRVPEPPSVGSPP
jgi:hypothetical protein